MVRIGLFRLSQLLFTAWGLVTLLFIFTHAVPNNDPLPDRVAALAGSGASTSAQQLQRAQQAARQRLGLTRPLFYFSHAPAGEHQLLAPRWRWNGTHNQYHQWLQELLHGNLGQSYWSQEAATALIGRALRVTVPVTCLAALLIGGLSVTLGLWLASTPGSGWVLTGLYLLDSLPVFVVALLLLLLLANPDFLTLLPTYGLGMEDEPVGGTGSLFIQPAFLVLPLASLVFTGLTEPTLQLVRALNHEARLDYMLTARAKGLSTGQALRRHALRNALLPTLTLFTELLPNLLAGAVVVELIFALPGLGRLLADAAATRDYPVLLGGTLVVLVARQLSLALADWLYQLTDPRLRANR